MSQGAIACLGAGLALVMTVPAAEPSDLDREILVAQGAGYDPMRPARPSPGAADRPEGNPELGGLPDAPGAEETYYLCSGCHSIALVKQQRLTDARWDYLWQWMIDEQGMPETDEETRQAILGYLKEHFSSAR